MEEIITIKAIDLKCSICLEFFEFPTAIECGHTTSKKLSLL